MVHGLSETSVECIITLGNWFSNIEERGLGWHYYHHISEWESGLGTVLCQHQTQVFVFRLTGNQRISHISYISNIAQCVNLIRNSQATSSQSSRVAQNMVLIYKCHPPHHHLASLPVGQCLNILASHLRQSILENFKGWLEIFPGNVWESDLSRLNIKRGQH